MNPSGATVEGELLVIPTMTALPRRCVQTNESVEESEYSTWDIPFIPSWLKLWMLVAWFLLLFVPSIVRRRCKFRAGVSATVRRRYFLRKLFASLLLVVAFLSIPLPFMLNSPEATAFALPLGLFSLWAAFVVFSLYSSPFQIVRYDGTLFWIKGCSPDFLKNLK